MEHLWAHLKLIEGRVTNSRLALILLDFDGTLAPIANTPQEATLPEPTRATLRSLAQMKRYRVGIVSGRPVDQVKDLVGIEGIIYAGNHGLELVHPQGRWTHPQAVALRPQLETVARGLMGGELGHIPGALIEDKGLIVSIHYRQVPQELHETIELQVRAVVEPFKDLFQLARGKKVLEVRPNVPCHKGTAVNAIARLVHAEEKDLIIYIGDDLTDEDAFAALRPGGIGIRVGEDANSRAAYFLYDAREVATFLESLVRWHDQ